jgi:hypothetical protein
MIVRDSEEFRGELERIDRVIDREAELPRQVFRSPVAGIRFIDFDELWSEEFFELLRRLTEAVGSKRFAIAVLKPDPAEYYFANFGKFALLKFDVSDSNSAAYINALHEDPGDSPADAIVHNSDVIVIYPENMRWLIYGDRNLEVGIVAAMNDDALGKIDSIYPRARLHSAKGVIDHILPTVFRGDVPADIRAELLRNYESSTRV